MIVNPSTGTPLSWTDAVSVVLATLAGGLVTIQFNIPPGQGSSNSLQVRHGCTLRKNATPTPCASSSPQILRLQGGSWYQSSSLDANVVAYAPPVLSQAGIQAVDASGQPIPGSFAMQPVAAGLNVVAPSDGSLLMRIAGSNLGTW